MTGASARRRLTQEELHAAEGRTVPDVIAKGLRVLFCGINPGRYSGAVGHHFAHPGNRFWKVLEASGFTDRVLSPDEERQLLAHGLGITNLVARTTAAASDLSEDELKDGGRRLEGKVRRYRPRTVAVVGISAYRTAFGQPRAGLGPQESGLAGTRLWVLPNPSGLQAHYQLEALVDAFAALRRDVSGD